MDELNEASDTAYLVRHKSLRRRNFRTGVRKAERLIKILYSMGLWSKDYFEKEYKEILGRHRKTRVRCSCPLCGNYRNSGWGSKIDRLTIQERVELEKDKLIKDELKMWDISANPRPAEITNEDLEWAQRVIKDMETEK